MAQANSKVETDESCHTMNNEYSEQLDTSPTGLTTEEAAARLEQYGPNAIEEKQANLLLKFLGYFWGPIPWMIEAAAVLSGIVQHWVDLTIILVMLVFNAVIGFW